MVLHSVTAAVAAAPLAVKESGCASCDPQGAATCIGQMVTGKAAEGEGRQPFQRPFSLLDSPPPLAMIPPT